MFAISSVEILANEYVCLDTKITILSELEAEILTIVLFRSAILENGVGILENGCQFRVDKCLQLVLLETLP